MEKMGDRVPSSVHLSVFHPVTTSLGLRERHEEGSIMGRMLERARHRLNQLGICIFSLLLLRVNLYKNIIARYKTFSYLLLPIFLGDT